MVLLDDISAMSRLDAHDMLRQISDFPEQLRKASSVEVEIEVEADRVCFCGLGGSAMGADILSDYLSDRTLLASAVTRGVGLPMWVDEDTFTLLISYSGNTRETLSMLAQAKKRGCPMAAVTSGGTLLEECTKEEIPFIRVPAGLQPRAALGYMIGSMGALLEYADLCDAATDLSSAITSIENQMKVSLPETGSEGNMAKQIAMRLQGKMPFIYAPLSIRMAARRWQTQINENSKMFALSGEIPEMDHNQIVAWIDGNKDNDLVPVFLKNKCDEGMVADIVNATVDIFTDFELDPIIVELNGNTNLESTLLGVVVGDFVSYYLAMLNDVDPTPVSSINELKKRLG